MTDQPVYPRQFMARMIFAWLFLILVWFFMNHSLLSQLLSPPLTTVASDNTFWLFHLLNIPQFILQHHFVALAFDVVLTTSCLTFIFLPDKTIFAYITVLGCWILYISYCSAAGHHFAQIGFLIPPLAFLVKGQQKFTMTWKLIRFWVCFLYFSGGLYKLYYGGFMYADNMSEILRMMNAEYFFFNDSGVVHDSVSYLINHQSLAQWLFRAATILDLLMIIGFFTYRYDRWLLLVLVLFHTVNYLLLHISFVEQSLIFATFLPWQKIAGRIINNTHQDD